MLFRSGEIITYRSKEHLLLLEIPNGAYQKSDGTFREEFYELLNEYENKLDYAAAHTTLPDNPDMEAVQAYLMSVNEKVVRDEIS